MKILLDGYFDHNFGDDLMLALAAEGLKEHELYAPSDKIKTDNVQYTNAKNGFDLYLKVTGSGFLIHNNAGLIYRLRDMRREKKYAPKRAVVNCNISGFINKTNEEIIKKQLSGYDFITTRDFFSYSYIRRNIPSLRAEKYPDMVFSLPDSMIPDTESEKLLGIAVHNSADCEKLAQTADGYIEETGNGVLLLCFDAGMENDAFAAERLRHNSRYKDKIEIVLYENISDMLRQMKRCGVILGIRFHSIILAARLSIPFVPMIYSMKTLHMLGDLKYKNIMWQADNFAVKDVLKNLIEAKPFNIDGVKETAQNHIIKLNEYIKQQR